MRTIPGRKSGEIYPIDLVDEYVLGVNQKLEDRSVECDYLEGDSIYVNLTGGGFRQRDEEFLYWIARHIEDLLNYGNNSNTEWVMYSEPNYWQSSISGDSGEVDELEDADTIQFMFYNEEKVTNKAKGQH